MAIDLGNNPVGTPPTADQSLQIKSVLNLENVENVALSTWTGSENLSLSSSQVVGLSGAVGTYESVKSVGGKTGVVSLSTSDISGLTTALSGKMDNTNTAIESALGYVPESPEVDVFVVVGQSNATGSGGDPLLSATPSARALQWTTAGLSPITIEQGTSGNETMGTNWIPTFSACYEEQVGRLACYVRGAAVPGAAMATGADTGNGNFGPSGTLRQQVVDRTNLAIAALEDAGYRIATVSIMLSQGEQDAERIRAGAITKADYKTALRVFFTFLRLELGSYIPIYIIRTGIRTGVLDTGGVQVRQAQEEVANEDELTLVTARETYNFPALGYMDDTVHYNQDGQNYIGELLCRSVLGQYPKVGQKGIFDGNAQITGYVGETVTAYVEAGSAISTSNNVLANVTSISLSPGIWKVSGMVQIMATSASVTSLRAMINSVSATAPTLTSDRSAFGRATTTETFGVAIPCPERIFNLTATTTIYLISWNSFTAGTVTAWGKIIANRIA